MEIAAAFLEVTGDAGEPTTRAVFFFVFFLSAQRPRLIFLSALF